MKKSTRLLFVTLAIPVLAISQTTEPAPAPVPALPPVPVHVVPPVPLPVVPTIPVPVIPPTPVPETPMPVPPANTAKPGDAAPVPLPKPEDVPERGKGKGKPDDKGQDQQKKPAPQDPAAILCRQAWKAKKVTQTDRAARDGHDDSKT